MTRGGRFPDHLTFAEPPTASAHRKKTESLRFPEASRAGRTSRRPPPCTSRSSTSSPLLGFDQTRDDDEREARERGHGARAGRGQARWADVGRAGDDRESKYHLVPGRAARAEPRRAVPAAVHERARGGGLTAAADQDRAQLHVAGVAEARRAEPRILQGAFRERAERLFPQTKIRARRIASPSTDRTPHLSKPQQSARCARRHTTRAFV